MPTYLGKGIAVPHARLEGIAKPVLAFARSDEGIPIERTNERAELVFLLLTPASAARMQPRLLADLVELFDSEYVSDRLRTADTPQEVIEAIRDGQEVAVD
jgi:mannitol/fructose-specific phosphotransferase system IIA component (Ntr-type)